MKVTDEASKFIVDLLDKNNKKGWGVRIYLAGMGCSGPQFGMAFQEKKKEGDREHKVNGFSFFYDEEAEELLKESIVDYIETPNGAGLIVNNPNAAAACGSSCAGCH